jgi:natural product precursor
MKKNIKLNKLAQNVMENREMNIVRGGAGDCGCACWGPSSTDDNSSANNAGDLWSPGSICKPKDKETAQ